MLSRYSGGKMDADKGVEVASEEGPRDTGVRGREGLASVEVDRASR